MTDPTLDEDDAPACANCGDRVDAATDRRVVTWVDDGEVRHRHFCSETCLADWD